MLKKNDSPIKNQWSEMAEKNIDLLNKVFGDVELTKEEEYSLLWLADWETSTIKNIISAFKKIRRQ